MSPSLRIVGYVSLLGPPQAVTMHRAARGTGSELDGLPLWLVVMAEFLMRGAVYAVLVYGLEEGLGREAFHRYELTFFALALGVCGALHTVIYYLTLGVGTSLWSFGRMQRLYRLGRNLTYAAVPALWAGLVTLWWQDMNHIPLFQGDLVQQVMAAVGLFFLALGVSEALLVSRIPTGLERDARTLKA